VLREVDTVGALPLVGNGEAGRRVVMTLLHDKHVLVFAATGAIGAQTARVLAREGARVWLSGRDRARLEVLGEEIGAAGAHAVDATDPAAVEAYVGGLSRVDGVFNAIGLTPAQLGYPARSAELDLDTFMRPQQVILLSTFLTSRTAGARMAAEGGGAVVTLSASLGGLAIPFMAALTATCGAIEAMTRSLAAELSPGGVRVNCVRGDAMPETTTIQETMAGTARVLGIAPEALPPMPPTALGRPLTVADTAATVAFLLSDLASATTAQVVDVGGQVLPG
jgi:NAD(P)-dependent dehydrogenase (short-subunit alcohol dehydrogenase family)